MSSPPAAAEPAASASTLRSLVTVVLNTSPCTSHPSTRLLEETVASLALAPGLAGCALLVVADGYRVRERTRVKSGAVAPDLAAAYGRYLARVEHLTRQPESPLHGATLLALECHHGCAHALRRGLARVDTPYVCVVQHDRTLCAPTDAAALVRVLQAAPGVVNYVGLVTAATADYTHRQASRGMPAELLAERQVAGVRLLPLLALLDSTHFASVGWYRRCVFGKARRVALPRGCYLEDTLGQAQLAELRAGGAATHALYGTFLAHSGEAQPVAVWHLDGHDGMSARADWHKWRHAGRHTGEERWAELESSGDLRYGASPRYALLPGFYDAPRVQQPPAEQAADAAEQTDADLVVAG